MSWIRCVVFDVGETLVDETRHWGDWADWLAVPRLTFFAAFGAVVERGWHHRRVFDVVRPGLDLAAEQARRAAAGWRYTLEPGDFYPDALPCLSVLRAAGIRVGIAGNQPEAAEASLAALGTPADFIASSASWGVEKPDPAFFAKVVEAAGTPASAIAYVGDRLDNDVLPAKAAGMTAVFIRRGPWGVINAASPEAGAADLHIETLAELPELLAGVV
ncbi:MAG TPA: HAD family hydrolase [Caulobacteraceae bacterium]